MFSSPLLFIKSASATYCEPVPDDVVLGIDQKTSLLTDLWSGVAVATGYALLWGFALITGAAGVLMAPNTGGNGSSLFRYNAAEEYRPDFA